MWPLFVRAIPVRSHISLWYLFGVSCWVATLLSRCHITVLHNDQTLETMYPLSTAEIRIVLSPTLPGDLQLTKPRHPDAVAQCDPTPGAQLQSTSAVRTTTTSFHDRRIVSLDPTRMSLASDFEAKGRLTCRTRLLLAGRHVVSRSPLTSFVWKMGIHSVGEG